MTLQVSTWRKSCPDALHFYGTVRNEQGQCVLEIGRMLTRLAVIRAAKRIFPRRHMVVRRHTLNI